MRFLSLFHLSIFFCLSGSALAETASLPVAETSPLLKISGGITHTNFDSRTGAEAHFDYALLQALPRKMLFTSTVVTDGVHRFEGFLMRDLLDKVGAKGETVVATALNDYVIRIPKADFYEYDVLVADTMDGKRLTPRDKGPFWIIYPRNAHTELQDIRYDYRWVWQLHQLEIQ